MRATLLAATLNTLVDQRLPVLVEGPPGCGKTEVIKNQVAGVRGWTKENGQYVHLHGPTIQPEDMGMPAVNADARTHHFTIPEWFPAVGREGPDTGLINIDEMAASDVSMQKVEANMIQERECHGVQMKPGWAIVATGNRKEDGAGSNKLLTHLRDRVFTLPFDVHTADWLSWAAGAGVRPEIVAFINFRNDLLCNFDRSHDRNATPRGWAQVSQAMGAVHPHAELETFTGRVGPAANEFVGFLRTFRELPDPDLVIADPMNAAVPTALDVKYAICGALAYRANKNNFAAVMQYGQRLPPEFMVMLIRDVRERDRSITQTKAFIEWAASSKSDDLL